MVSKPYLNLLQAGAAAAAQYHLVKAFAVNDEREVCRIVAEVDRIFKRVGGYMIIAILIFAIIYPLTVTDFADKLLIVQLIFINGFVIISSYLTTGKFAIAMQANQKLYLVTLSDVSEMIIGKWLAIGLILYGSPFIWVKACVVVGALIRILLLYLFKEKHFPWLHYKGLSLDANHRLQIRTDSKNVFVQQLTSMAFATTDIFIISIFCGVAYASVYAVYNMVITGLNQLMNVLVEAPYASFGNVMVSEDVTVARRIFTDYEHIAIILSTALAATFLFLIRPFIALYTSGVTDINYDNYIFAVFLAILFLLHQYRTLSAGALNTTGNFEIAKRFYILEMVINFVLSMILVFIMGMQGVVLASIIAVTCSGVMMVRFVNRVLLLRSPISFFKKVGLNFGVITIIATISTMTKLTIHGYDEFLLLGFITFLAIGIIVSVINLLIWKDTFFAVKRYAMLLVLKKRG